MKKQYKTYKVRTSYLGSRVFIIPLGYKDALRLRKAFGGKVI